MEATTSVTSPMFAAFKADKQISFIRPYDPKQAIASEGYRHAILRYRTTDKNVAAKPAKMVTVPQVTLSSDWLLSEQAAKVLVGVIEDQQDAMIKALIDADVSLIEWEHITVEKCLDALTAIQVSQRLSKEQIEGWVMATLQNFLRKRGEQVAESKAFKVGSDEHLKQVAGVITNYKNKFGNLAAPVPSLMQNEAQSLQNMLLASGVDDDIAKSLKRKLHAILNPEIVAGVEL